MAQNIGGFWQFCIFFWQFDGCILVSVPSRLQESLERRTLCLTNFFLGLLACSFLSSPYLFATSLWNKRHGAARCGPLRHRPCGQYCLRRVRQLRNSLLSS